MESLFRLVLHQQSLVQSEHPDPRFLSSIEYHKRDLAIILGTAKWQVFADVEASCFSFSGFLCLILVFALTVGRF